MDWNAEWNAGIVNLIKLVTLIMQKVYCIAGIYYESKFLRSEQNQLQK